MQHKECIMLPCFVYTNYLPSSFILLCISARFWKNRHRHRNLRKICAVFCTAQHGSTLTICFLRHCCGITVGILCTST